MAKPKPKPKPDPKPYKSVTMAELLGAKRVGDAWVLPGKVKEITVKVDLTL